MTDNTRLKTSYTTTAGYVRLIIRSLERDGFDGHHLCAQSGIDYEQLSDSEARIDQSRVTKLWQNAVDISGNEAIGLNLAANVTTDALHLLGYSLMSSTTLLEGCRRYVRYQRVVSDLVEINMNSIEQQLIFDFGYRENTEVCVAQSIDAAMAVMVSFARWLTQCQNVSPEAVYMIREEPSYSRAYTALFRCPVYFSQPNNQMHYAASTMDLLIPTAHKELALLHDRLLGSYLDKIDKLSITDLVEEKVLRLLPDGLPKAETVAAALNMSSRTLHRRLSEVNLNFQNCLEQVRKKLARSYLEQSIEQTNMSLNEVSYLLGFAEVSSFHRAFKRWYGMPPGQFLAECDCG